MAASSSDYSDIHFFQIYVNFHKAMSDRNISEEGRGVVYDRVVDSLRQILDEATFEYSSQYADDDQAFAKPASRASSQQPPRRAPVQQQQQQQQYDEQPEDDYEEQPAASSGGGGGGGYSDVDHATVLREVSEIVYGSNLRLNKVWSTIRGTSSTVSGQMLADALIKMGVSQPAPAIIAATAQYMPDGNMTYGNFVKALAQ